MVKVCNPNIKRQDLMDAANKEWQKYRKEPETEIRKLISQYLAANPPIIRTANFFLPPNLPTQRQALELIQEANSKINEYENLLIHTSDKDLRLQISKKLKDALSRSEMKPHIDEHYYLASVKLVRVFASTFANFSLIISQDDKAKVGLGIPAVGRTFQSIQSFNEPVTVSDHDFPRGSKQKLIPSVYLIINPEDTNESLRQGQLSIYIRPEYFVGTSSMTHMKDLLDISKHNEYAEILKHDEHLKSIWILLVDGGPDENPKHLKNIIEYCRFFRELNLDYLSVQTHAPYQSAYNPVERSMCTLSEKLAGIELPVDKFGSHLNSQGVVIDKDLARRNFEFAGKCLCEIWERDKIHGKQVYVDYVEYNEDPFQNNGKEIPSWLWIESHTQICRYSLDIRKCSNQNCCNEIYAKEAFDLLRENNGFLLPLVKGKDNHYLNPIHILQYMDKMKLPNYDEICPSISSQMHERLCCNVCNKYFPTMKMISNHKKANHPKKVRKQNTNQTFAQPSIESTTDMLSAHLISPSSTMTYLSAEEINATLDSYDTQQIELSNAAILEDFTILPSIGLSHKFETSNLLEALSDIEVVNQDTIIEFFKKKEFIYKDEDENENTPDKILQLVKSNWKSKNYMTKVNTIKALDTYSKKEFSEFLKDNDRLWNETREILSMADLTIIPSKNDIHNRLNQIIPGTNPIKIPEIFRPSKDAYFMRLAEVVGLRTNCLKRKVGCVLVKDECKVIATGYNGTPKDINNCNEGNCDYCNEGKDLGIDFCSCMHAERNALLIAGINAKDCILYCNT
ncbi:17764_t:CDS:2 [Gigaspora margarita]|uniref:17764_t:CDS:1 n=1 Tax=Gigaspora margarita TaxID=4874 RepID=A0ABM8VZ99_GIGMA|nr:17764_t:CDS:2 [Gigaspora margarita]